MKKEEEANWLIKIKMKQKIKKVIPLVLASVFVMFLWFDFADAQFCYNSEQVENILKERQARRLDLNETRMASIFMEIMIVFIICVLITSGFAVLIFKKGRDLLKKIIFCFSIFAVAAILLFIIYYILLAHRLY